MGKGKVTPPTLVFHDHSTTKSPHIMLVHLPQAHAGVVRLLLQTHPDAAKIEVAGWLPLHLAAQHAATADVLELLLEAYPDAASVHVVSGSESMLPTHLAANTHAPVEVIRLLHQWTKRVQSPRSIKSPRTMRHKH